MATKQIIEGARRFKAPDPVPDDDSVLQSAPWKWPLWPGSFKKDKYLIDIKPRKLPAW